MFPIAQPTYPPGVLAEIRAMLEGVREVADNPAKPASPADIAGTLGHLREFTRIAEHEMHELALSCTRARRQMLEMMPAGSRRCTDARAFDGPTGSVPP